LPIGVKKVRTARGKSITPTKMLVWSAANGCEGGSNIIGKDKKVMDTSGFVFPVAYLLDAIATDL
jgi:hypothetical protein